MVQLGNYKKVPYVPRSDSKKGQELILNRVVNIHLQIDIIQKIF